MLNETEVNHWATLQANILLRDARNDELHVYPYDDLLHVVDIASTVRDVFSGATAFNGDQEYPEFTEKDFAAVTAKVKSLLADAIVADFKADIATHRADPEFQRLEAELVAAEKQIDAIMDEVRRRFPISEACWQQYGRGMGEGGRFRIDYLPAGE
jgi:hypothetical protein